MSDQLQSTPAESKALPAGRSLSFVKKIISHPMTPVAVAAIVVLGCATYIFKDKLSLPSLGSPDIVVFDPVKFVNAQRAAASFLVMNPNNEMALALTQVAKQTEAVIAEESKGALVLVRQAVVIPDKYPDITDRVILRFGLNPNVPTVNINTPISIEQIAPTDMAFSPMQQREEKNLEYQLRAEQRAAEEAQKSVQERVLP